MKRISLIEYIIVASVGFIVAAMAVPRMSQIRRCSNQTVCIRNMHSLALAITMWEDDHHRLWHEGWINKNSPYQSQDNLNSYLESEDILDCPSAQDVEHEYYYQHTASDFFHTGVNCYYFRNADPPHRVADNSDICADKKKAPQNDAF